MSEFTWQNQYLLGNRKVDEQHQQLFVLANQLVQSKNQADLAENAMRLYRHAREHFQAEETFMKKHGYPNLQSHIQSHNLMLDKLVDVSEKISKHEWQQQHVLVFMREWIGHILDDDAVINAYMQDNSEQ